MPSIQLPQAGEELVLFTGAEPEQEVPAAIAAGTRAFNSAFSGPAGERNERLAVAARIYENFLATAPRDHPFRAEALLFRARCFDEMGGREIIMATQLYRQLAREHPNSPLAIEGLFRSANIRARGGAPEAAVEELRECLTMLTAWEKANPGAARPEFMQWIRPHLAQNLLASDDYAAAREMFQTVLGGNPPAAVRDFALQGLSLVASRAAEAAVATADSERRAALWQVSLGAIQYLRSNHEASPVTHSTIRAVAGIAYDHANARSERANWERARDLFTHLAENPAHRIDAQFFLGQANYRLGGLSQERTHAFFSQARAHFLNYQTLTNGTTHANRAEAISMGHICQIEEHLRLAAMAVNGEPPRPADAITQYRSAISYAQTNISAIAPGHLPHARALSLRAGRAVLPLLDTGNQTETFTETYESLRSILGTELQTSRLDAVLFNMGMAHLGRATGDAAALERTRGLAILDLVVRDFPTRPAGHYAGIQRALTRERWEDLRTASQAFLTSIGTANDTNRPQWMHAQVHLGLAQLRLRNFTDAISTLGTAESALPAAGPLRTQWREVIRGYLIEAETARARPN